MNVRSIIIPSVPTFFSSVEKSNFVLSRISFGNIPVSSMFNWSLEQTTRSFNQHIYRTNALFVSTVHAMIHKNTIYVDISRRYSTALNLEISVIEYTPKKLIDLPSHSPFKTELPNTVPQSRLSLIS